MLIRKTRALIAAALVALGAAVAPASASAAECSDLWDWLNTACRHIADTYKNGGNTLLVSGYAWHTPWTWTPERRAEENELAWGAGWGRSVVNENGATETVYGMVFSDSHSKPEYNLGYAWTTFWGERESIQAGLGYTALIIARTDIAKGWPFPAILPLAALRYDRVTVYTTYIPNFGGGINHGSVFYFFGQVALN